MIVQQLVFYLFSFVAIASAVMVISARNPVHSVLFLILAFFNAAGLFVLIGAEFLAMVLVVVYVGAVAVLFIFVVMMLDINFVRMREGFLQYLPVGLLIGGILCVELVFVVGGWVLAPITANLEQPAPLAGEQHRGSGRSSLHRIFLPVSGCRTDPAGGDHRGDYADPSPPPGCQAAGHRRAGPPFREGRNRA